MILSRNEIIASMECGEIVFSPEVQREQLGEASVDLRMGYQLTKIEGADSLTVSVSDGLSALQTANCWKTKTLKKKDEFGRPESYDIAPSEFILSKTFESITVPRNMIARVEGRSTYARVGLSMHQTAPWIQPGWSGPIILEIMNNGPLKIKLTPEKDRPCQITFFRLTTEVPEEFAYGAKEEDAYQCQVHPIVPPTSTSLTI